MPNQNAAYSSRKQWACVPNQNVVSSLVCPIVTGLESLPGPTIDRATPETGMSHEAG